MCPKSVPDRVDALMRAREEQHLIERNAHWQFMARLYRLYPKVRLPPMIYEKVSKLMKREEVASGGRRRNEPALSEAFAEAAQPWAKATLRPSASASRIELPLEAIANRADLTVALGMLRECRWLGQPLRPATILVKAVGLLEPAECLSLVEEHGGRLFLINDQILGETCAAIAQRLAVPMEASREKNVFVDEHDNRQRALWDWARLTMALLECSLPEHTTPAVYGPAIKGVLSQVRRLLDPAWEIPRLKRTAVALLDEALALQ